MDQFVGGTADEHKRTQQSRVQTDSGNHVPTYHWKGAYHALPEGFQWKRIGAHQAFELWMHGSAEHGYPPFKEVTRSDFSSGGAKKRLSDLKYLMKRIQEHAESKGIWVEDPSYEQVKRIYMQCEEYLLGEYKLPGVKRGSDERFSQISWQTVVKNMRKRAKTRNGENSASEHDSS
uniref:Uncharacterized protein n=1 Tax=Hanusia phi TaxID=3032 RepID=A0A7S0HUI6_9CRYP|mmetsp:Transcript_33613/g.75529  ORF Transcript_33613/g.75529 Transcript_33613/m.75529 type:complete len:176 (+) Transcript_33613:349-876(+)